MIDPSEKFVKDYKEYKDGYLRTMTLRDFLKYEGISKSTYYNYERRLLEREKIGVPTMKNANIVMIEHNVEVSNGVFDFSLLEE